jgi:D-alanine-D-alanine ligase-like ATP-grasp enzyme
MGLRYGCIDMIVTPAGEHVFLEVNPNGQWYFVQLKTGLKIAEAIADLLV